MQGPQPLQFDQLATAAPVAGDKAIQALQHRVATLEQTVGTLLRMVEALRQQVQLLPADHPNRGHPPAAAHQEFPLPPSTPTDSTGQAADPQLGEAASSGLGITIGATAMAASSLEGTASNRLSPLPLHIPPPAGSYQVPTNTQIVKLIPEITVLQGYGSHEDEEDMDL